MNGSWVALFAGVVVLAFSLYSFYKLFRRSQRIKAGKDWPAVPARVTEKKVHERRNNDSGTTYTPVINYSYSVMGREYTGRSELSGLWGRKGAQKAVDQVGESIEVHYNPNKPEENTHSLDRVKVTDYLFIVLAVILAVYLLWTQVM